MIERSGFAHARFRHRQPRPGAHRCVCSRRRNRAGQRRANSQAIRTTGRLHRSGPATRIHDRTGGVDQSSRRSRQLLLPVRADRRLRIADHDRQSARGHDQSQGDPDGPCRGPCAWISLQTGGHQQPWSGLRPRSHLHADQAQDEDYDQNEPAPQDHGRQPSTRRAAGRQRDLDHRLAHRVWCGRPPGHPAVQPVSVYGHLYDDRRAERHRRGELQLSFGAPDAEHEVSRARPRPHASVQLRDHRACDRARHFPRALRLAWRAGAPVRDGVSRRPRSRRLLPGAANREAQTPQSQSLQIRKSRRTSPGKGGRKGRNAGLLDRVQSPGQARDQDHVALQCRGQHSQGRHLSGLRGRTRGSAGLGLQSGTHAAGRPCGRSASASPSRARGRACASGSPRGPACAGGEPR